MMKHLSISLLAVFFCWNLAAQEAGPSKGFSFTPVKELSVTPVRNQASSGTCWSFSGLGMVEAELLRMGKGEHYLSPMFIVHKTYEDKAVKYVRMHGETNFSAGGSFADVFDAIRDYGLVPQEVLPGLNYGEENHKHNELDAILTSYVKAVVQNPNRKLSPAWLKGYREVLNTYLGEIPETFTYQGVSYTPQSFTKAMGIVPENYVSLTSFTHHPFYSAFAIEVPDNWRWALSYNLPLDELMGVIEASIEKGYTVAWAADVSERGFNRKGIMVVPDVDAAEGPGSDQTYWTGLSQDEKQRRVNELSGPVPEKKITQEMRQEAFDNYETTDDHGMLICGTVKDQYGSTYYKVKNSWGVSGDYQGFWYASLPFVSYKTMTVVVHKDVLSKDLKKKLGIQ